MVCSCSTYSAAVPRPEQVGVARLVVALPVLLTRPAAVPDHLADELGVRALVQGGRRRQEVGRLPGPHGELEHSVIRDLLVAGQLAEQGVHRVPAVLAGLGFDLRPVRGRPGPVRPPSARACGTNSPGRAEQAVADAAHHAEPDSPWFKDRFERRKFRS